MSSLPAHLKTRARLAAACLAAISVIGTLLVPLFAAPSSAQTVTPIATRLASRQTDDLISRLANSGSNSTQILQALYPNASLASLPAPYPRPRLFLGETDESVFRPEGANRVTVDDQTLFRATPGSDIRIALRQNRWHVYNPDPLCPANGCDGDVLRVLFGTATSVYVSATGKSYFHGRFTLFKSRSNSFRIVLDYLRLEDYLKGLNVSTWAWPREALRARAIEARTQAMATYNSRTDSLTWQEPFDLYAGTPDLPYLGDDVERNSAAGPWLDAVTATAGTVLSGTGGTLSPPTAPAPVVVPPATQPPSQPPATQPPVTTPPTTPPSTAAPQTSTSGTHITFSGRGWGHGVGMSQYGARGRAEAGHSYSRILGFYYPGATLSVQTVPINDLRIFLRTATLTTFTPRGGGNLQVDNQVITQVSPGAPISVRLGGNNWHISVSGTSYCPAAGCVGSRVHLNFNTGSSMHVQAMGRSYQHGRITLSKLNASTYRIVLDSVHMEDYLRGIAEMPTDWSLEAQKVQAVAARSYAYAVVYARRNDPSWTMPFDIYSSTNDQNYIGDTREANPNSGPWFQAIANTSNQVMLYNGEHVVAHYSSSNGGYMSEDTFRSLANRKPYLRAAPDPYDSYTNPFATWQVTFSHADISRWLNSYNDTSIGTLVSVSISGTRETSGRVNPATVTLTGTSGTKSVSGSRFYAVVNAGSLRQSNNFARTLRSTLFNVGNVPPSVPDSAAPSTPPTTTPPTTVTTPPQLGPTDTIALRGSFDSLRFEGSTMYASGTAVAIPAEDLSISFLIDEETVEAGQLNQQVTVQTDSGRSVTGSYAFKNALQLSRGPHSVCVFASDGEREILLGCRTIGMQPQLPAADFVTLESPGPGQIRARGWAYDIDAIDQPVAVRVLTRRLPDGTASYLPTLRADMEYAAFTEDVNKLAGQRAWEATLTDVNRGNHEVCAWAADTDPSQVRSNFLGCQRVAVR